MLPESPRLTWHLCHVKWQRFGLATARASAWQTLIDFKKRCAEEGFGRVALVVTLDCGEEIFMDTCKLFKRLPRGACYTARLLKKPTSVPEGLEAKGHGVWVKA